MVGLLYQNPKRKILLEISVRWSHTRHVETTGAVKSVKRKSQFIVANITPHLNLRSASDQKF